jgi:CheY-like chemotaxis protein
LKPEARDWVTGASSSCTCLMYATLIRATGEALASQTPVDVEAVRRRILVVEDSPDGADTLAKLLRVNGHEVRTEADGPNAPEAVGTFQPDIILLDIGLPGMNGYEVATQLRKLPGMDSALLIALTGYGQERDPGSLPAGGL